MISLKMDPHNVMTIETHEVGPIQTLTTCRYVIMINILATLDSGITKIVDPLPI